jgi:hypothetical protein
MGVMVSPVTGASGNVEFLLHARKGADAGVATALIGMAVAEAEGRQAAADPAG